MAASRTTPAPVEPPPTTRTSVSSVGTATGRSIAAAQGLSPGRGLSLKPVALRVTFFRDSPLNGDCPSNRCTARDGFRDSPLRGQSLAKAGPGTVPGTGTVPQTGGAPRDVFQGQPPSGTVPERTVRHLPCLFERLADGRNVA